LFGKQAIHVQANLIIQYQGERDGHGFCSVVELVSADIRADEPQARGYQHEFIRGDMVLRPQVRYTDGEHCGGGRAGLAKGGSLYPESWRYIYDQEPFLLVPNSPYDPACKAQERRCVMKSFLIAL
jgi:hypothetical protein